MKILIDIRLLGKGGQSGIEEYTRQIVSRLLKKSLDPAREISIQLFYSGWRKTPLKIAAVATLPRNDVIDWPIPNKIFGATSRFLCWPKIDRLIKTDLIYSPHFNLLRHSAQTPRILTIHDLSFIHYPYFFNRRHRIWHWLQDIKTQARQASKIITVSQYTKNDVVELLGVPEEKIEVIYPAPTVIASEVRHSSTPGEAKQFQEITASPTAPRNDSEISAPYILYLGTIEPRKNVQAIIKAFDLLKKSNLTRSDLVNLKLVIAGQRGWLCEEVDRAHRQSPFKQDIIFTGPVSADEKSALYRSAEVFVFPSFFEGFGLPPLEAQIHGCPVIASNRASLPEVLGDSALLVDPWKINDLAEAIKLCLRPVFGSKIREGLVDKGLKNTERFDWNRSVDNLTELFEKLA